MKRYLTVFFLIVFALTLRAQSSRNLQFAAQTSFAEAGDKFWMSIDADTSYVVLACADKPDGAWKEPVLVIKAPASLGKSFGGQLWTAPDGALWLFYHTCKEGDVPVIWSLRNASPQGAAPEWSRPSAVGRGLCSGRPAVAADGSWALPFEQDGPGVLISSDNGGSWKAMAHVASIPAKIEGRKVAPVLFPGKDLFMICRSWGLGRSYSLHSSDGGVNWSAPVQSVPLGDYPAEFLRLSDGRLLMVRNYKLDEQKFIRPVGLYAYLSDDDGTSWYGGLLLDKRENLTRPHAVELPGGRIALVYNYSEAGACEIWQTDFSVSQVEVADSNWKTEAGHPQKIYNAGMALPRMARSEIQMKTPRTGWSRDTMRLVTYNIQYQNKPDDVWSRRLGALLRFFRDYRPDIVGAQEINPFMTRDLINKIGDRYAYVASDVRPYNPIYYLKEKYTLLDYDVVWFSDVPETAGYGSSSPRDMVWARFRSNSDGKEFYVFNNHYDHRGIESMQYSSELLLGKIKEIAGGMPAFCTGDFNSDETFRCYKMLLEPEWMKDSLFEVEAPVNAEYDSCPGFVPVSRIKKKNLHIDHIFFTPNSARVLSWELILADYCCEVISDHQPIMIQCQFAN